MSRERVAVSGPIKKQVPSSLYGIYAVWYRHALVYVRTWMVNFLPPMTEPIFYLLAFGFGLSPMVGDFEVGGREMNYLKFIGPAMIAVGVCFQSFFEGAYGSFIRLRFQRTWHALLTGPLGFREIFFGDFVWAATRGIIAGMITGVVVLLLGQITLMGLLFTLPLVVLGSVVFSGMGIMVAGLVKTIDQINVPVFLFVVPMFTLSGTFFPRDNLPWFLNMVATVLPLAQLVDLIRIPIVPNPQWVMDLTGLIVWGVITTVVAYMVIFRQVFR